MAELKDEIGHDELLPGVELGFAGHHSGDEFFDLFGRRAGEGGEAGLGFGDLGFAFDGGVPDEDGHVHRPFGGGVVAARLLENRLREGDELVGEGGLPRGGVDRGGLGTAEVALDIARLVVAEGTGGPATRMGGGHWKWVSPKGNPTGPLGKPFPRGVY